MKIPKVFIPKRTKGIETNDTETPIQGLEDLILENINGLDCDEIILSKMVADYLSNNCYSHLGIDLYQVSRIAIAKYNDEHNNILLMEFKEKKELLDSLERIYTNGTEYLDRWCPVKFLEKFLHKNNIAIYINGHEGFIKKAAEYYKSLGFKYIA